MCKRVLSSPSSQNQACISSSAGRVELCKVAGLRAVDIYLSVEPVLSAGGGGGGEEKGAI